MPGRREIMLEGGLCINDGAAWEKGWTGRRSVCIIEASRGRTGWQGLQWLQWCLIGWLMGGAVGGSCWWSMLLGSRPQARESHYFHLLSPQGRWQTGSKTHLYELRSV